MFKNNQQQYVNKFDNLNQYNQHMQNQFGQYGNNMNPNYGMYPQMQSEMMQHYPMNYPQMPNMNMQSQHQDTEKMQEGEISNESLENLIVDALYE